MGALKSWWRAWLPREVGMLILTMHGQIGVVIIGVKKGPMME